MRNALALIADIGFLFGKEAAVHVKSQITYDLMKVVGKFQKNQENQSIVEYALKVKILNYFSNQVINQL
jgi:hypothetical protein